MDQQPEFSHLLKVETLGEVAKRVRLDAAAKERVALATRFELVSVESLTGDLIVERIKGGDLVRVRGRTAAEFTQSCAVTGVPIASKIEEIVDERFTPTVETENDVEITLDAEDPPEPFINGEIDLGEVIAQYLGVAIDPYLKAPGAEIPQQYQPEEDEIPATRKNPFEVLTTLKPAGE
jgi:uncharacterized metal-binding protein YceD (DUF177 family)